MGRAWRHAKTNGEVERNRYQFVEGQHLASSNEKEKEAEGGSKAQLKVEKNRERTAAGWVWIVQKATEPFKGSAFQDVPVYNFEFLKFSGGRGYR